MVGHGTEHDDLSVGYIARPFGGILMAHYADRLGRKVMFNFTLVFMALPCLLTGLMPTYAQIGYMAPLLLVLLRLIQGAALGGEVPNAWVFVAEHVVAQRRGLALGLLQAGLTFGYLLGAFTVMLLTTIFDKPTLVEWAWRIPFVIGGVFGVIAVWPAPLAAGDADFSGPQAANGIGGQTAVNGCDPAAQARGDPVGGADCPAGHRDDHHVVVTPMLLQSAFACSANHLPHQLCRHFAAQYRLYRWGLAGRQARCLANLYPV